MTQPTIELADPKTWGAELDRNDQRTIVSNEGEVVFLTSRRPTGWRVTDGQDEQPTEWFIRDEELNRRWIPLPLLVDAAFLGGYGGDRRPIINPRSTP